jgi:hypothetical protein
LDNGNIMDAAVGSEKVIVHSLNRGFTALNFQCANAKVTVLDSSRLQRIRFSHCFVDTCEWDSRSGYELLYRIDFTLF